MVANTETPLVSVITPSLNAGRYIEDCIRSVKAQEYPNVEHIVVDGGSRDNTLDILKRYQGTYNLKWVSGPDEGASDAANKGLKLARGDIMAILPSDDLLLPWAVSSVISTYGRNPGVDLIYGDTILMQMGDSLGTMAINPLPSRLPVHLTFGPISFPSVFWTKRLYTRVGGFDQSLQAASDYDFTIRAAMHSQVRKTAEPLACYRYRGQSESLRDSEQQRRDRQVINSRYFGGRQRLNPRLLSYELGWMVFCSAQLLSIMFRASKPHKTTGPDSRLLQTGAVSRPRLLMESLVVPLFYTNFFFGRRIRHGFLDAKRLLGNAAESPA